MTLQIKHFPQSLLFSNKNTSFVGYRYFEETLFVCFILTLVLRPHCKAVRNNRIKVRIGGRGGNVVWSWVLVRFFSKITPFRKSVTVSTSGPF